MMMRRRRRTEMMMLQEELTASATVLARERGDLTASLDQAYELAGKVLAQDQELLRPDDTPHRYSNKFQLVESAVTVGCLALWDSLFSKVARESLEKFLEDWKSGVIGTGADLVFTLRKKPLKFKRSQKRERTETKTFKEVKPGFFWGRRTSYTEKKVVITEYDHTYDFVFDWDLAFKHGMEGRTEVLSSTCTFEISSVSSKSDPMEELLSFGDSGGGSSISELVDASFLLDVVSSRTFRIDRTVESCRTPRRNVDTESALKFFSDCHEFCCRVEKHILDAMKAEIGLTLNSSGWRGNPNIAPLKLWSPVLASFAFCRDGDSGLGTGDFRALHTSDDSVVLTFLDRHLQLLLDGVEYVLEDEESAHSGELCLYLRTCDAASLCSDSVRCIGEVEQMLFDQMVDAVGKILDAKDFRDYMEFHSRNLFLPEYAPRAFSHTIRRGPHSAACGILSIEDDESQSIRTS
eukprot:g2411.t1